MSLQPFANGAVFGLLRTTGPAGIAMGASGPVNLLSWTAPNDGLLHRAQVFSTQLISSATTGGLINFSYTSPGGGTVNDTLFGASEAANTYAGFCPQVTVAPGGVVQVVQFTGLTGGAGTVWAEIWGS